MNKPYWTGIDSLLIVVLTCLAGLLRFAGIARPYNLVFDEHYAADACLFVLGPQPFCATTTEIGFVHPPLAKWLIGAGIWVFGFNTAGWRVAPLIAGTLSIALTYLLARRLTRSTMAASLAAGLLTFDFLHFVMSRTAMLDIFVVFFGLASFLCLVYDADCREAARYFPSSPSFGRQLARRRWLVCAGAAGGAAVACKWSGGYLLGAVAVLAIWREWSAGGERVHRLDRVSLQTALVLATALVVLPALVYVASFAGTIHGALFAWPWAESSWVRALANRHQAMVAHHTGALYTHPYMSPAWSWLFVKRPVLFYFRQLGAGNYQEILAFGNPVLWWTAVLALIAIVWRIVRTRSVGSSDATIVAGFLAGYVPWFVFTRREAFLYYLLPAVPFLYLAVADIVAGIRAHSVRSAATVVLCVASIVIFTFFRPLLVGTPMSRTEWERRMVFSNCGPQLDGARKKPVDYLMPPPSGWCWV